MILRALRKADIPQLLGIEEAAQAVPWSELIFVKCVTAGYPGWVVEYANRVVGFILMTMTAGECHILNLCIHPQFQHQGLGKQLLQHTLEESKRLDGFRVYLEVRRSNLPAIELYKKMGFEQIGERKDYYPVPSGHEDAIVFARDLG